MSERGSFTTEYMYCNRCFEEAKKVLVSNDKWLCSLAIPSWEGDGKELPIIAGKIGGGYEGEEIHYMEELIEKLNETLCHPIRIVVLSEWSQVVFYVTPKNSQCCSSNEEVK